MKNEVKPEPADWSRTSPAELLASHLERTPATKRGYGMDLDGLAAFLTCASRVEVVKMMVEMAPGSIRRVLDRYRARMIEVDRLAPKTIARRLGSTLGLLRRARDYEIIAFRIHYPIGQARTVRDNRGPSRREFREMLAVCEGRPDAKGSRDLAMLYLMGVAALRAHELLSLDLAHVDAGRQEIAILEKGRHGRRRFPVLIEGMEAIEKWLEWRGRAEGPLFMGLTRGRAAGRLTYVGLHSIVVAIGNAVGCRARPHGLRHRAATEALRLTNGNLMAAMSLTRHRRPQSLLIYLDEEAVSARSVQGIIQAGTVVTWHDTPNLPRSPPR